MDIKTVKDMIEELRTQYKVIIALTPACNLINNAVNELVLMHETAIRPVDIEIEGAVANEPYTLPTLGVVGVKKYGFNYRDYKADADSVTFKDSGDYTVTALTMPDSVSVEDDDMPVHVAYNTAILVYLAHYATTDPEAKPDITQFYALASAADKRLSKIKRTQSRVPARIWR